MILLSIYRKKSNLSAVVKGLDNTVNKTDKTAALKQALEQAETVIIGAGAGLSAAAGFSYSGERFRTYFQDFAEKYHFEDMYSGGFFPYETLNEYWAFWSRNIYANRYVNPPKPLYQELYSLVEDKDYFVITTNVDHCFQKAGFDKERLFYTQGDYGLFQCSVPCRPSTYDNEDAVRRMLEAQGYVLPEKGARNEPKGAALPEKGIRNEPGGAALSEKGIRNEPEGAALSEKGVRGEPEGTVLKMEIPDELLPRCPVCGKPMTMNLRVDDTFVEDEGWHKAAKRYQDFLDNHKEGRVLFLELGVGCNTPGIIKYPFWQMTSQWTDAFYACLNYGEAYAPKEIREKSLCVDGDISAVLQELLAMA